MFPTHVGGIVDETFLGFVSGLAVLEQHPAPRRLAGLDLGGMQRRIRQVGAEGGFHNGLQAADGNDAPGRGPWERGFRIGGLAETGLARVGVADHIFAVRGIMAQAGGAIVPAEAGFAEQQPCFAGPEQGWENPARTQRGWFADRDFHFVIFFIGGIGGLPSRLRHRHRLQPGLGIRLEMEGGNLLFQRMDFGVCFRKAIAVGHAVVGNLENDVELAAAGLFEMQDLAHGRVEVDQPLGPRKLIPILHRFRRGSGEQLEAFGKVGVITHQPELGIAQNDLAVAFNPVNRRPVFREPDADGQFPVGTGDLGFRRRQQCAGQQ